MAPSLIDLKFLVLNAENLFLLFDGAPPTDFANMSEDQWQQLSTSVFANKSLRKTKIIAQIILDESPDIVMLCEVGGIESLKNFSDMFLQSKYSPVLIEGNSDRNIDVGFLIKKNLPFYYDISSNKNRAINYLYPHERQSLDTGYSNKTKATATAPASHKFSRDVAELSLFTRDREKPFLLILLTHLKSPLDPERVDPNGFERRRAELQTLVEIYKEHDMKLQNQVPILVAGDFNGNASEHNTDPEFVDLYAQTKLKDVLELAGIAPENRATFYHVKPGSRGAEGRQIDFCFLSETAAQLIDPAQTQVYRYQDAVGMRVHAPTSLEEKLNLPSDHYPIITVLNKIILK